MRKLGLSSDGVLGQKRHPIKQEDMKRDDQQFLNALDALLEKHRRLLVDELAAKISNIPIAINSESSRIIKSSLERTLDEKISIDDSIYVVEQKIDHIEKSFDELAKAELTEDTEASKSISRLKALKEKK